MKGFDSLSSGLACQRGQCPADHPTRAPASQALCPRPSTPNCARRPASASFRRHPGSCLLAQTQGRSVWEVSDMLRWPGAAAGRGEAWRRAICSRRRWTRPQQQQPSQRRHAWHHAARATGWAACGAGNLVSSPYIPQGMHTRRAAAWQALLSLAARPFVRPMACLSPVSQCNSCARSLCRPRSVPTFAVLALPPFAARSPRFLSLARSAAARLSLRKTALSAGSFQQQRQQLSAFFTASHPCR